MRRYHDSESADDSSNDPDRASKASKSEVAAGSSSVGSTGSHKCSLCPKTFFYSQDRDEHENCHRGIKEHECNDCGKAYSSRKALLSHMKLAHGAEADQVYACEVITL